MAASPSATLSAASPTSSRSFWRFGLISGTFLLVWLIGSAYGLGGNSPLDDALCHQLAAGSTWGLRLLGWQASVSATTPNLLLLQGQPAVIVGGPCDGLVLYTLLAGFVLAYPGPARRRLWFIPMGIAALWLLNVVRIVVLALNHRYSPATFDFNHHYAFSVVAYSALCGLWMLWTRQSLPVGVAYLTLFLALSLVGLGLLLPARAWPTVWRCYVGMGLVCLLLALAGRVGAGPAPYRLFRMLLDFMTSLLPVASLLVLLWRPLAPAEASAATAAEE